MASAGPLAPVGGGLIRSDGRARDLPGNGGEDAITFEIDTALLERLSRHHEGGDAGFHVRGAESEDFAVPDGAAQLAHRFELGAKHAVFFAAGEARVHMTVDLQ